MPPGLPPSVEAFLTTYARTLEELQLLLAIIQAPGRWWDGASAAAELMIPASRALAALDHFASHNLLDIRITGDVRYKFQPGTPEIAEAARATLAAYREQPLDLAQHVKPAPRSSLTDFADAFRIRRDDR